jgi:hypothetical protein
MKTPTLLLLFTLSILQAHSQKAFRVSLGLNTGTIADAETTQFNAKTGYQFNIDAQFGKKIYVQPGLSYVVKSNWVNQQQPWESTLNISSVKVPVFVGYRFAYEKESKLNFYAFTGPSVHIITTIEHNDEPNEELQLSDDDIHDVEWTWTLGGGFENEIFFY